MEESEIAFNWLAHIAAAFVPMIIGALWYSPLLFEKAWMKSIGMTEERMKEGNMFLIMGLALVMSFISTFVLSMNVNHDVENFATFKHGALHGGIMGLMFVTPILVIKALFERRSFTHMVINFAYWIIVLTLMGGILCAWQPS